jgi:tetratricopeptide (TPR) repeat protein
MTETRHPIRHSRRSENPTRIGRMPGGRGSGSRRASSPDEAFVGRDAVIRELVAAADDVLRGTGSVVVLTGEAGIGKTTVARTLATRVRDDLVVSWGRCSADHSAPPFWPWRALVDAEPDVGVPDGGPPAEWAIGAQRFERLNELRAHVVERARARPLLHVIEDLQWADVASVLLLAHIATAVVDAPLMVVGTLRSGEPLTHQLDDAIEDVRRSASVRALQPLRDEDVAALIADAGMGSAPDLTALVQARTGGNPLFVTELLRVVQTGDPGEHRRNAVAASVPSRVAELVGHRLARLPHAVAAALAAASVIGSDGDAKTLAAVHGSSVELVLDLVEQARAAHLLEAAPPGRWQFRHDLVRDAVYAGMTATSRARQHASVLEALAANGSTPPPVLAHHALAAQPLFDPDRAVALAARAGESAFAQHAYEEAVAWFERALAAAPLDTAPRWRAELLVLCGEAHRHIGEIGDARRAFASAADLAEDPALLARAALGYADPGADLGIAYRADDPVAGSLLERAIAAQPAQDSVTTVLLEARLAAELYFSDEPARAVDLARSAIDRARRLDEPLALGAATAVTHDAFVVGQAELDDQLRGSEQLLTWARTTGSAAALLTARRARVFDLLAAGDIPAMDTEILAFRRLAEPLRVPGYVWWPSLWAAMRALLEGRHDDAEARGAAACEVGLGSFPTLAFLNLSFLLFFLRREQGRLAEMEGATRDYAATNADIPALRVGLTFLLAELGRIDEARGMLDAIDDATLDRLHDRNWPASWFQLARAVTLVGDRDLAATLLAERHRPTERCVMVSLATVCLGASDLGAAWLLHTIGDLDAADRCYSSAEATNARIGARAWLAQARVDHARLLLDRDRDGDRDRARSLAELAATAVDEIGLASITGTLDAVRHRLAAGDHTPASTPSAATFRRSGAIWELAFAGRTAQVPHARGLSDLAYLLARPTQDVSVMELVDEPGSPRAGVRGAPAFDERARREIHDRLRELDAEEADAEARGDGDGATRAREQRQLLAETVARDLGLGGRSRRIGDPAERARKTVSTRIRRAIAVVTRGHPELGRHLERSVDTGAWCSYRPAEPVRWTT